MCVYVYIYIYIYIYIYETRLVVFNEISLLQDFSM